MPCLIKQTQINIAFNSASPYPYAHQLPNTLPMPQTHELTRSRWALRTGIFMAQSESNASALIKLPEQLGDIPEKIQAFDLADFFTSALARRDLTNRVIERSFRTESGLFELGLVAILVLASFYLSGLIWKHYHQHHHYQSESIGYESRGNFFVHLLMRLSWPILMIAVSMLGVYLWRQAGYRPIWFHLMGIGAAWLMIVRICTAIIRFSLPNRLLTAYIERTVSAVVSLFFFLWMTNLDDIAIKKLQAIVLPLGKVKISLFTILQSLFWVSIVLIVALWISSFIESRLMRMRRMDSSLKIVSAKIIRTAIIILSLLIALPMAGIDLTLFSVFWGALGVGLGFGLQKIASNYISGFIILLDRSIRLGDRLIINDFTGYVTQITSRFVVLRDANGAEALVPNEHFIAQQVINESFTTHSLSRSLTVQVDYKTDIPQALAILTAAAQKQSRVDSSPAPAAFLLGFADNGIDLNVSFWVKDPENGFLGLNSAILLDIWTEFKAVGIEFPYPQREVRILNNEIALTTNHTRNNIEKQDGTLHEPH